MTSSAVSSPKRFDFQTGNLYHFDPFSTVFSPFLFHTDLKMMRQAGFYSYLSVSMYYDNIAGSFDLPLVKIAASFNLPLFNIATRFDSAI